MKPSHKPKIAVLLGNLGTPDAPTPQAVSRYLKQFLSDKRVIEIPQVIWQVLLRLVILPLRSKRVAHNYASIWGSDSPMREILVQQTQKLGERLSQIDQDFEVITRPVMSYGNPGVDQVMTELSSQGVQHFVVLPAFAQFSATSTGALYDAVTRWSQSQRNLPAITLIKDYFADPLYIQALADSVRAYQAEHGASEKLVISFHGIPEDYEKKGDPYPNRCRCTGAQLAHALGLAPDQWITTFQSRFGRQEWVKPYTDATLESLAKSGVRSVQVISPAFSADCLETLEELEVENREVFMNAGGESYAYIPALNASEEHIDLFEKLARPHVEAWQKSLRHWV